MGFMYGIKIFSIAIARVTALPELRRWYFKTLVMTVILAAGIIGVIFVVGSWGLTSYIQNNWYAGAAFIVWALMLFYLGGQLAALLMNALVLVIGGESALTRYYLKDAPEPSDAKQKKILESLKLYRGEVFSMLRTLLVACLAWPLFLIPFLIPFGVLIFAWAMSGDALAVARRLAHVGGKEALQDHEKIPSSVLMGLGVLPSALALFPVVGWVLLPILQVAGLELQLKGAAPVARVEAPKE